MADIALDYNPLHKGTSAYKDLLVVNGSLLLTSDAYPIGQVPVLATNPILQDVIQSISFFLAEWFLDNTQGLPYWQQILIKNPDQSKIDAIFKNVILGRPGVQQLSQYSFSPNFVTRVLTITFRAVTTQGVVVYSGTLNPVTGGTL